MNEQHASRAFRRTTRRQSGLSSVAALVITIFCVAVSAAATAFSFMRHSEIAAVPQKPVGETGKLVIVSPDGCETAQFDNATGHVKRFASAACDSSLGYDSAANARARLERIKKGFFQRSGQ